MEYQDTDLDAVVSPRAGCSAIDRDLFAYWTHRGERVRSQLRKADDDSDPLTAILGAGLSPLDGCALAAAFRFPVSEGLPASTSTIAGLMMGAPGVACSGVISGPELKRGIYLPHPHMLLRAEDGCCAFETGAYATDLTWTDGVGCTLPHGLSEPPAIVSDGRLQTLPRVHGIRVLNSTVEASELSAQRVGEQQGLASNTSEQEATLRAGLELLSTTWPDAYYDCLRMLWGIVLLSPRDHSRSHAAPELPGVVLMTADSPVKVADLLCHEVAHIRLNTLLQSDPVLTNMDDSGFESPWRPDLRPLRGILLGVHSFINVCEFYSRLGMYRADVGDFGQVLQRQASHVREGWQVLQRAACPTSLGRALLTRLEQRVAEVSQWAA